MDALSERVKTTVAEEWKREVRPFLEQVVLPAIEAGIEAQGYDITAVKADLVAPQDFRPLPEVGAGDYQKFMYLAHRCVAYLNQNKFIYRLRILDRYIVGELREDSLEIK